jgi:hypothetical protein
MKKNNKPNIPDNLSTPEQLREFREENPLIYTVEPKVSRGKNSTVDSIANELQSYINEGSRYGEDEEIFELCQEDAITLWEIIELIKQARAEDNRRVLENLCYDLAINYERSFLYQDSSAALMSDYSRKKSVNVGLTKSLKIRTAGRKEKLAELTDFIQQELCKNPKTSNKELLRQAETGGYGGIYKESSLVKHIKEIAAKERKKIKGNN